MRLKALVCAVLPLVALTGCIDSLMHDDLSDCPPSEAMQACYIQLSVRMAEESQTRADDPTGGEKGDGYENGQDYEDEVSSVAVFLYKGYLSDDNRDAKVSFALFTADDEELTSGTSPSSYKYDARYTSIVKKVWIYEGGMNHALVAANPSEDLISWAKGKFNSNTLTLGDVLDRIETKAWEEEDGSYSSFLMSSHDDVEVNLSDKTEDNPAKVSVDVQRMAARVDYTFADGISDQTFTISEEGEEYGDENYAGSTVKIEGAMLINNLNSGSFLIKRVDGGLRDTEEYLGQETTDDDGIATDYVVDPWTNGKVVDSEAHHLYDIGDIYDEVNNSIPLSYGIYYPGYAQDSDPNGENQQDVSYWTSRITSYDDAKSIDDDWKLIGYTMENTTYSEFTSKKYCTGVVFQATFTPAEGLVICFDDDYDYATDGEGTFFRWYDALFATVEDVMMDAYPSGVEDAPAFTVSDRFQSYIDDCTTWQDLEDFAESLHADDPTGYEEFLLEAVGDNELTDEITDEERSSLYWSDYMTNVCGYEYDETNHQLKLDSFDDKVDHDYTTTRWALYAVSYGALRIYEKGQCFYSWWIRHSNDGNDKVNGTMEYSIVRNNVYKLTLESVYSIGGDVPEEGIVIHAGANIWGILDVEEVDL